MFIRAILFCIKGSVIKMLMIVGEYLKVIDGAKSSIEGLAFDVSLEIARNGISVSFESLISEDSAGLSVLEQLINADILFNPSLCNSNLLTATYNLANDEISFNKSCSAMLSKEQFEETVLVHDDVKLIHFGSFSFYSEVTGTSIISSLANLNLSPVIFFNPSLSKKQILDTVNFIDKSKSGLSACDIVQIDDSFLDEMYPKEELKIDILMNDYPNANILYVKDDAIIYLSSLEYNEKIKISKSLNRKIINKTPSKINSIITGAFLSYLHENGVFGDELTDPVFVANSQIIDRALDFVIEELL
jgi:hypothetical protein